MVTSVSRRAPTWYANAVAFIFFIVGFSVMSMSVLKLSSSLSTCAVLTPYLAGTGTSSAGMWRKAVASSPSLVLTGVTRVSGTSIRSSIGGRFLGPGLFSGGY